MPVISVANVTTCFCCFINHYYCIYNCNNQVPVISVAIVTTCFCSFINIVLYIVTTKCLAVILVVIVIVYLQQRVSVV